MIYQLQVHKYHARTIKRRLTLATLQSAISGTYEPGNIIQGVTLIIYINSKDLAIVVT